MNKTEKGYKIGSNIEIISYFTNSEYWYLHIPILNIRLFELCKKDATEAEILLYIAAVIQKKLSIIKSLQEDITLCTKNT